MFYGVKYAIFYLKIDLNAFGGRALPGPGKGGGSLNFGCEFCVYVTGSRHPHFFILQQPMHCSHIACSDHFYHNIFAKSVAS